MADNITTTAHELAQRLADRTRNEQQSQLVAVYRRHSRTRRALVDAHQAAGERARKQGDRDEAAIEAEIDRASEKAVRAALARHDWKPGTSPIPQEVLSDIIVSIVATGMATSSECGTCDEAESLRAVADQVACHEAEHGDVDRISAPDAETGGTVSSSIGYEYLIDSLHRRENAPQRLLVHTMMLLEYTKPEIRRVLSEARGEPVDDASVRKLVKRIGSPNSAPMA